MQFRLYRNQISSLSDQLIRVLIEEKEYIEVDELKREEFSKDVEAVFHSYIRTDRRILEQAKITPLNLGMPGRLATTGRIQKKRAALI